MILIICLDFVMVRVSELVNFMSFCPSIAIFSSFSAVSADFRVIVWLSGMMMELSLRV